MSHSPTPTQLANLLPDEPQWIDLKGLLIRTQTLEGVVGQASEWR